MKTKSMQKLKETLTVPVEEDDDPRNVRLLDVPISVHVQMVTENDGL